MRVDKEKLGGLASLYDQARAEASRQESKRKALGKEIVGLCRDAKKRRVQLDGWTVGYDAKESVTVDEERLRPVLKELGIYKQVTVRVVDQDRVAKVLESADPVTYKRIVDCMKKTTTRYPHVRRQ